MFVFFLRAFFVNTALWKLALVNYLLGVLDEFSQLSNAAILVAIRQTYVGRLLFGVNFLWSYLVCYAIGTLTAWGIAGWVDRLKRLTAKKEFIKMAGVLKSGMLIVGDIAKGVVICFLSGLRSLVQHRCIALLYVIPLWIFDCVLSVASGWYST